ncbi:hypothetical protein E2I00_015782 [Balaenoptera physalus]|uniref:Uncharacterized protein n=1 Tax=Balaenoptera physalus TaxID=9770 RepID=A0A643CH78_BALPH|nr:hypothetical protein E2I00_015782 [Balaenoptera physalus]
MRCALLSPAQATGIVTLDPEVMDVARGSSFTLTIQLQRDDGEVATGKCLQEGGQTFQKDKQVSGSEVAKTQTRCHSGFQCISYPRSGPKSRALEPRAALESAGANSPLPEGDPCDLPAGGHKPHCPEDRRPAEHSCAQFSAVRLGPPAPGYHPILFLDSLHEQTPESPYPPAGVVTLSDVSITLAKDADIDRS